MEEQNWRKEHQLRRRRVYLRAALVVMIVSLVAIGLTQLRAPGPDGAASLGTAPGFRTVERDEPKGPFELARASGQPGATTIPAEVLSSIAALTSTTTTTLPPPSPTVPIPPAQSDPICQGMVDQISLARSALDELKDPAALAQKVAERLTEWIPYLQSLDAQKYGPAIAKLEQTLAEVQGNPSADQLLQTMQKLLAPDTRFQPLIEHVQEVCPAVFLAR